MRRYGKIGIAVREADINRKAADRPYGGIHVDYTEDQQKVINARKCNLLVSAAAGSGKTAVLVERIIQMVTDEKDQIDIDHILVVTFTNAAASQMRSKIADAVSQCLTKDPENAHLQRQAALVLHAQITTIDKFCVSVIRNHFQEIDLDPSFRIAEEGELKLIKQDTMNRVLEEFYMENDPLFGDMCETLSPGNSDIGVEDAVERLYITSESYPWPEEWLKEHENDYTLSNINELGNKTWWQQGKKYILGMLHQALRLCRAEEELSSSAGGPAQYTETIQDECAKIKEVYERIKAENDYDIIRNTVAEITFSPLPRKKDPDVDPEVKEQVKALRGMTKEIIADIQKKYLSCSSEMMMVQMSACDSVLKELIKVTLRFIEEFTASKRNRNIIDFNDIGHMALSILARPDNERGYVPTAAAGEYHDYFREIMIDEYQDSNLVQEYILASISGQETEECSRFMVGDVKQSIYRFRLARPELFLEKYDTYREDDKDNRRICLQQNFRSRRQVVDAVNFIFRKIMRKELGGIDYDENAELKPGAAYKEQDSADYKTEMLLFDTAEPESDEDSGQNENAADTDDTADMTKTEFEAAGVAERIHGLMTSLRVTGDDGVLRPLRYSDIVILMRSPSSREDTYRRILENEGIPVSVASSSGYFGTYEIRTLLHTLRIINNPQQDIPLYGVLHSCIGGFSDEELAGIRGWDYEENKRPGTASAGFCNSCAEYIAHGQEGEVKDRLAAFMARLDKWRAESEYMPIHQLLQCVMQDTGYRECVSAMMNGGRRLANVDMLLRKAEDFEKTSYYGLYHFIRYMEQLEKYEVDYGEASNPENGADSVQIMSIHKSKGLEFPVCFVCGLGTGFNQQDANAGLVTDADMGIGMQYMDMDGRVRMTTLRRGLISEKMRRETLGEELRILYVALTRAKEKLIMTSCMDSAKMDKKLSGNVLEDENGIIETESLRNASSMSEWIMMSGVQGIIRMKRFRHSELGLQRQERMVDRLVLYRGIRDGTLAKQCSQEEKDRVKKAVERCYDVRYAYDDLKGLYTKTTVSELKIQAMHETDEAAYDAFEEKTVVPYIPKFVSRDQAGKTGEGYNKTAGGAERGTAYHRVMELMDFRMLPEDAGIAVTEDFVKNEVARMLSSGRLDERSASLIDGNRVAVFMASRTARRMADADRNGRLYREQPFSAGIPASRLDKKFPENEMVMIQGIIDAFWQEDSGFILLDYKTDAVKDAAELVNRYKTQLDLYSDALGQMHRGVTERWLYAFRLDEEIKA